MGIFFLIIFENKKKARKKKSPYRNPTHPNKMFGVVFEQA